MAFVRQRASGRWQGLYYDPSTRLRSAGTFRLKSEARDAALDLEQDVHRGGWVDPTRGRKTTLGQFFERYMASAKAAGRPAERTRIAYREVWRTWIEPALGRRPLAAITRADVVDVVAAAGRRSAWRGTDALKVLRLVLNRAVAEDLLVRNPAHGVQAPRIERKAEPWVLTPEEIERLAGAVPDRYRALVVVGAYTALRWSELVALRVDRLDQLRRRIRVEGKITEHGRLIEGEPKTAASRRVVAIPEFVAVELAEHLRRFPAGPSGLVFTAPEGGPIRRPHFYPVWRKATTAAGLQGFRVGHLRHTGASLAIAAGANPFVVARRLGHTSMRMVERHYGTMFEGLDREVGDRLAAMHADRKATSKRLRPGP